MPLAPVKVMSGADEFWQTVVAPLIEAVGKRFTVTVAVPV